jgi:hypothetical protein
MDLSDLQTNAAKDRAAHLADARDTWIAGRSRQLVRKFDDVRSATVTAWAARGGGVETLAYDFCCWLQESQDDPANVFAEILTSQTTLGRYASEYATARACAECERMSDANFEAFSDIGDFRAYVAAA